MSNYIVARGTKANNKKIKNPTYNKILYVHNLTETMSERR
jgi:hypothetical protein